MSCRRLQASPQSFTRQTNAAKLHLQCWPVPANAILPSPWPRLPRRTTCGGEPRPSVCSPDPNTTQESRDRLITQHQSARKGGCPATRARGHPRTHGCHCHHRHSCGMPFALYESLTSPCMMPPLTTAECAELEEGISLTLCHGGQTHARFAEPTEEQHLWIRQVSLSSPHFMPVSL